MSNFAANIESLKKFSANLRKLPVVVAQRVAAESAPAISAAAETTFAAGQDPYGNAWAPGVDGQRVTLRRTGTLAARVRYVAIGTKIRVALGVPYAKFQVGKRPIFPRQGGALPPGYVQTLTAATDRVCRDVLEVGP